MARNIHFRISEDIQPPQPAGPEQVKGLGDKTVTLQNLLDDSEIIQTVVPIDALEQTQGPFFTDTNQDESDA